MRAAAQFARRANVEDADFVAVLFAEQHHRTLLARVVDRHHPRRRRRVREDLGVHERFDPANLLVGQRCVVREVEARTFRIDE